MNFEKSSLTLKDLLRLLGILSPQHMVDIIANRIQPGHYMLYWTLLRMLGC